MSAYRPRTMAPSSGARSAWAPPRVAARSASLTLMPKCVMASEMTSGMDVMPLHARCVVGAERDRDALVEQRADRRHLADLQRRAGAQHCGHARGRQRDHVLLVRPRAAGPPTRSPSRPPAVAAPVRDDPQACSRGSRPGRPARAEHPARLALGEAALIAVHVHAVGPGRGRVRAPGPDRVDVVVAAAEVLRRHRVRGQEGHVHPGHARLVLQRPQQPDVGEFAVAGEVVAGLGLDGRGPAQQPVSQPRPAHRCTASRGRSRG